MNKTFWGALTAGAAAGTVTGLFGGGGGMVLIPLLTMLTQLRENEIFPSSICIILPICIVSLAVTACQNGLPWNQAFSWLLGSTAGGLLAGLTGQKIPALWLHRGLGILIIWGGWRYLWS